MNVHPFSQRNEVFYTNVGITTAKRPRLRVQRVHRKSSLRVGTHVPRISRFTGPGPFLYDELHIVPARPTVAGQSAAKATENIRRPSRPSPQE